MNCDIEQRLTSPRALPDGVRCIAWRKNCVCGYRFPRSDLYGGNGARSEAAEVNSELYAGLITEGKLDGGERLAKGAFRILTSHSWPLISLV
jgi:hypothetical protein